MEFVLEQAENLVEDFSGTLAVELSEAVGNGPSVRPERVGCLLVERAGRSDPDALESQRGMLGDTIEVGVVVQYAEFVGGGDRCDEVVLVWEAVKAGRVSRELGLGFKRGANHCLR